MSNADVRSDGSLPLAPSLLTGFRLLSALTVALAWDGLPTSLPCRALKPALQVPLLTSLLAHCGRVPMEVLPTLAVLLMSLPYLEPPPVCCSHGNGTLSWNNPEDVNGATEGGAHGKDLPIMFVLPSSRAGNADFDRNVELEPTPI